MLNCPECSKSYASQSSLNRHVLNHKKHKQHLCHWCGVIFYRADVLCRHLRLHQDPPKLPSNIPSDNGSTDGQRARKRRHTACNRCREHRIRCRGGDPCASCIEAANTCRFSKQSGRVSHIADEADISQRDFASVDRTGADEQGIALEISSPLHRVSPQQASPQPNQQETDSVLAWDQSAMYPESVTPNPVNVTKGLVSDEVALAKGNEDASLLFNPVMVGLTTWPWLHENLYLPSNQDNFSDLMGLSRLNNSLGSPNDDTRTQLHLLRHQQEYSNTHRSRKQQREPYDCLVSDMQFRSLVRR